MVLFNDNHPSNRRPRMAGFDLALARVQQTTINF